MTLPVLASAPSVQARPSWYSERPVVESGRATDSLDGIGVLAVDDDASTLEALGELLTGLGARVVLAASAAQALGLLEKAAPDVLVCDLAMPGEDGFELIRKVRALPPEKRGQTPAVALTALASDADRQRALAAGYQEHLPKPTDTRTLVATIVGLAGKSVA